MTPRCGVRAQAAAGNFCDTSRSENVDGPPRRQTTFVGGDVLGAPKANGYCERWRAIRESPLRRTIKFIVGTGVPDGPQSAECRGIRKPVGATIGRL